MTQREMVDRLGAALIDIKSGLVEEMAWVGEPSDYDGEILLTIDGDVNLSRLVDWFFKEVAK